jgi:hypothetical protein
MRESQIVFRGSVKKALLLLLISVGLVVLGAWASTERPVIGWLCIAFFSLGIPASLLMMRPGSTYLKLDADGIDIVNMSRRFRLRWSEVDGFRMASVRGARMIAIDYSAEYTKQKAARAVASALSGMEGAIADHYTAPLEQVLETLNHWKAQHGGTI